MVKLYPVFFLLISSLAAALSSAFVAPAAPPKQFISSTGGGLLSSSPSLHMSSDGDGIDEEGDELLMTLRSEALLVAETNPELVGRLKKFGILDTSSSVRTQNPLKSFWLRLCTIFSSNKPAKSFEEVISRVVAHLLSRPGASLRRRLLQQIILNSFMSDELENGWSMRDAVRQDAMAFVYRDPACANLLEAVLCMKGFASLVTHRAANRVWKQSESGCEDARILSKFLQTEASIVFGVDIHPAAQIGAGVMIDHASGIVIGETAVVGDDCTIMHGVTLGATGKESGDRHPKVGKNVLIGAGTQILGNIHIGDRVKIGAGSVVLRAIPSGATAVGAPARIIGFAAEAEDKNDEDPSEELSGFNGE